MLNYKKVKLYYDAKVWTKAMVAKAVEKGVITATQYEEITGEAYQQ